MAATKRGGARRPLYEHIPTGSVWRLVKAKPVTLQEALVGSRSAHKETRRPTKVTFGRDYRQITDD